MAGITQVFDEGKVALMNTGWTSFVTTAKLYTNLDALVDTQTVTFAFDDVAIEWKPTADIVFDVASSTQDVSYVTIGTTTVPYYSKLFASLYDFTTAGTLTIDSWVFTLAGSGTFTITDEGVEALFNVGVLGITSAQLRNITGLVTIDTQSVTFSVTDAGGTLEPTADIVFNGTTADSGRLIYIYVSAVNIFVKDLGQNYVFTTPGTLTVDSWTVNIT